MPNPHTAAGSSTWQSGCVPALSPSRVLVGPTIRLRSIRSDDQPALRLAAEDSAIQKYCFPNPEPTEVNKEQWVRLQLLPSDAETARFAIADHQDEALYGAISLHIEVGKPTIAESGFWIAPEFRQRGFALEAVEVIVDWVFRDLEIERMELFIDFDNLGSQSVATRAGFQHHGDVSYPIPTGVTRDVQRWIREGVGSPS